jgi:hypothetical protein
MGVMLGHLVRVADGGVVRERLPPYCVDWSHRIP